MHDELQQWSLALGDGRSAYDIVYYRFDKRPLASWRVWSPTAALLDGFGARQNLNCSRFDELHFRFCEQWHHPSLLQRLLGIVNRVTLASWLLGYFENPVWSGFRRWGARAAITLASLRPKTCAQLLHHSTPPAAANVGHKPGTAEQDLHGIYCIWMSCSLRSKKTLCPADSNNGQLIFIIKKLHPYF